MQQRQKPLEMDLATLWDNFDALTELHPNKIILTDKGDVDLKRKCFWQDLEIVLPEATGVVNGLDTNIKKLKADKASKVNLWGNRAIEEVSAQSAQIVNVNFTPQLKRLSAPNAKELMIQYSSLRKFDCTELTKFCSNESVLSKKKTKEIKVNDDLTLYPFVSNKQESLLLARNNKTKNYTLNEFYGDAYEILSTVAQSKPACYEALYKLIIRS